MLWQAMMDDCVMMDKTSVPDGIGGFVNDWQEGAAFKASIEKQSAQTVVIAEQDDYSVRYLITTNKSTLLDFHDVLKRTEDGAIFRIIAPSADKKTPGVASFQFAQAEAERWHLA